MPRFLPCPRCDRHVQLGTGSCPFCGAKGLTTPAASPLVLSTLIFGLSLASCDREPGPDTPKATKEAKETKEAKKAKETKETKEVKPSGPADDGARAEPEPERPRAEDKYGAPPPRDDIGDVVEPAPLPADDGATVESESEEPRPAPKYGGPPNRRGKPKKK